MSLGIQFNKPKEKKINVPNSSHRVSKGFYFRIKRLSGSIGSPICKEVEDPLVVILYSPGGRFKGLDTGCVHLVVT